MEQKFGLKQPGRVHHVAIVVRDMDAALGVYRDQLGIPLDVLLPIESDGVRIAFLPVGESNIELVEPTDPGTGVARFLETRGRGSINGASKATTSLPSSTSPPPTGSGWMAKPP